jgi:adenine-specific DNA methylase
MEDKNTTGGASAASAKDPAVKQTIPYATSGEVFTIWLNRRLSEKGNVNIPQGTKQVLVNRLLPDGRLDVEVPDADGSTFQQQFIAFDEKTFDLLLPKLATI